MGTNPNEDTFPDITDKSPDGEKVVWDGNVHSYRPGPDWSSRVSPSLELHSESDGDIDPVTFEIIRNRMWSSNLAHGETLVRISGSPVFQSLDFNMCLLTEDGEVVMNAPFITYLDVGAPLAVRYIMENFSESPGIHEGDMFVTSDPWIGASHQMDVQIAAPVFVDGKLFAWVSNAGHQYDMGGIVPGGWPQNSPDVYSDPTFFTPFKLVEKGTMRRDLEKMYRRQSRFPDLLALDLRAQLAGCRYASREMLTMCEQYGATTVKAAMRRILDNAQKSFREKLRRIPDGTWSEVRWLDERMPGDRSTYRLQTNVHKQGDRLIIDNDGTDEQQEGPIGFVFANFSGAVLGTLSVTMLCEHLFALGGAERQIEMRPKPGLLSSVDYPSAVSGGVCSIITCIQGLFTIIARMLACDPELKHDATGSQTDIPLLILAGTNDQGQALGTGLFDYNAQGSAGKPGRDGTDTTGTSWSPLMPLLNAEGVEQFFPIMYLYRRELVDGGGAGEWRGGTGMEFAVVPYRARDISAITNSGGSTISTHGGMGLFGGYPIPTSTFLVRKGTDIDEHFANRHVPDRVSELTAVEDLKLRAKSNGTALVPGDVLEGTFGGGGGYGDPVRREPERVVRDLQLGYVSREVAADVHGVLVDDAGALDEAATARRRADVLAERGGWRAADDRDGAPEEPFTPATGEPPRAVHEYVVSRDQEDRRVLACSCCDEQLSDYAGNYKLGLLVAEDSPSLIPRVGDPKVFLDDPMVFRRFCCPGCRVLMATEIVREGDPVVPEMMLQTAGPAA